MEISSQDYRLTTDTNDFETTLQNIEFNNNKRVKDFEKVEDFLATVWEYETETERKNKCITASLQEKFKVKPFFKQQLPG